MLKEDDARDLLEELRRLVRERGFESFDAHATMLIMTSADTQEPIRTAEHALNAYSKVVIQLLRSIGAERINDAKRDIAKALELDDITIELDLADIRPILPAEIGDTVELKGIDDADQLAGEIEQFNRAVRNFSYPDPDSGPPNGGPSP
jgi:hypothetical protein